MHTRTLFTRLRSKRISCRLRGAQCRYQEGAGQASGANTALRQRQPLQAAVPNTLQGFVFLFF